MRTSRPTLSVSCGSTELVQPSPKQRADHRLAEKAPLSGQVPAAAQHEQLVQPR